MTTTLVTFLGRGRDNPETGYRSATYRFPDGTRTPTPTSFFGLALAEHLGADELVLLGTANSQWGVLVENLAKDGEDEELRIELMDAEAAGTVDQSLLDRCAPLMTRATGHEAKPHLIPFGRDASEQMEILGVVADAVNDGDVHIDVTHGFRHLGMIGFLSALMLQDLRPSLDVHSLWYGALDMQDQGVAPVLRLDGLDRVRRWVDALGRYDATGNYGVFAPLLIEDGVPKDKAKCLVEAAHHERTLNLADAKRKLQTFLPTLDTALPGASGLFQTRLEDRLLWVQNADLGEHQRKLALEYLDRGDYLRAAVFGWEAMISLECRARGLDEQDYANGRGPASESLNEAMKDSSLPRETTGAFYKLRTIRNALAHGTPPDDGHLRSILRDDGRLRRELKRALERLLNRKGNF